ncbi:serine/threonine-protein kinase [Candidatus Uabimicrobium sp. HlEnr_7]|uniref:serine/threonine-protein kinase n=1 Tax=Candidatus Uabimicrobium helgolandensis TaxID=3095367 RepID=UPI0035573258
MSYIVSGYKIEKPIKSGGFAEVYYALRIKDKKYLAIKVLNEAGCKNSRIRKLFQREAKLVESLKHPNIIKLDCVIKESKRPAIALEYFESETLKAWILNKNPLSMKRGVKSFIQMAKALHYLHENNIIHKDVKPENILVNKDGEARLIDFSIAEKTNFFSKLLPKKREGTPLYMSPEQVRKENLDPRCDIYSLGATFFEVFAGTPHIQGKNEKAILQKQMKGSIPKIRQFNKSIPHKLEIIILRMLEKDKDKRYKTMREVLYEVGKFADESYEISP